MYKQKLGPDFDINEYCKKIRMEHPPPYKCPIPDCSRTYKSLFGFQYHLQHFDHDNPLAQTPNPVTPKQKKGRSNRASMPVTATPIREALTFEEAQKMVQFEIDDKIVRVNLGDDIKIMSKEEMEAMKVEFAPEVPTEPPKLQLPEPSFKEMENYNITDAPPRPNAYIRFIEKSAEELDGEVEYDVDEEDTAWLSIMNEKRESTGLTPVTVDTLELLMDRLEKESYFQAAATGQPSSNVVVDDDAVCCICMDGECQNTNVILFCDMCNLAVHQDCYGVPYIPEGQWLCRRCLQSPSRAVDCVLCPNHGGAFKQTDRSHWAHVVCALWIPEVRFANTVFLEPIDSIETIPPARWKLTCYVCKQRGVGACIQCHKTNCYAAFHVTCAQQAGLYMKMDTVKDQPGGEAQPVLVQKTAYCDAHTPADGDNKKEDSRQRMKQARKILAKKRSTVPVILIPTIPPERIQEIGGLVQITKKSQFIQRLIAYWTLKRQFRNGVPLLRRLQSQGQGGPRDASSTQNVDTIEMCRQLKYWQCLRQDLERARLLCELVRKREKMKMELTKAKERVLNVQLKPMESSMRRLLDLIASKDQHEIFLEPVDLQEVPDYMTVVSNPMDLSTMRMKLDNGLYSNLKAMEKDFELMIHNCLEYNSKDTLFYRSAVKMREQGGQLFKQAHQEFKEVGFLTDASLQAVVTTEDQLAAEIDKELLTLNELTATEIIDKLENLLAKTQLLKNNAARTKRLKQIRAELTKLKKNNSISSANSTINSTAETSQLDFEHEETTTKSLSVNTTTSSSPEKSPVGVNRRTAVLFTRKAQAVIKKPEGLVKEKIEQKVKRRAGRPRRSDAANSEHRKNVPDSFRVYRGKNGPSGDEESDSGTSLSTCYSLNLSDIETLGVTSDSETSQNETAANSSTTENSGNIATERIELKPLQLVWAKCRGYPWYPALIIDPEMPKDYVYKGVPIPAPPTDVINLRSNHQEEVYLVLFFDAKRTWQWLPADKLEILKINSEKDKSKMNEPRKPADRKAVKKAYQDALSHYTQVTEEEAKEK